MDDKALGMERPISRRDFMNGVLVSAALPDGAPNTAHPPAPQAAPQDLPGYYPPTLTGMRGSHPGSFEVAHALRDGTFWDHARPPVPPEQDVDLVVVGAGMSGLAAAYFFRQQRPDARILILDNHDDFGGHAKRNEFHLSGRMALANGGTLEIDSPRPYSAVASGLISALGIAPEKFEQTYAGRDFYAKHGMREALFLSRSLFGQDKLLQGLHEVSWTELLRDAPIPDHVKQDAARIGDGIGDPMPGLSSDEKKDRLSRISYSDYMTKIYGADPAVLKIFSDLTHDEWGVGTDAVSALDAWGYGLPGFDGLKLAPGITPRMAFTPAGYEQGGSYTFHFPDGNASIARLLVRALVPAAMPGHSATDIVTARADYAQLDRPGNPVRIRLSSTVVGARNLGGADRPQGVELVYSRFGQLTKLRAKACVLACYNVLIPYLCPDMSEAQKDGLRYMVKTPLIYTSVALSNWRAFRKSGAYRIYAPGCYHTMLHLDQVTNMPGYQSVLTENDPVLVHLYRTPCQPGLDERAQNRAGRWDIINTSLETYERETRAQLAQLLGPYGFDPAQDITAITVNRWPHGYAYEYNYLFDPVWKPGEAPHEIGRKPFGRIAIANSDSGAGAYTDVAIDQGHRAVRELLERL